MFYVRYRKRGSKISCPPFLKRESQDPFYLARQNIRWINQPDLNYLERFSTHGTYIALLSELRYDPL